MIRENENWVTCGKSISQLIEELQTFENQDVEVRISLDEGQTHFPISIVANKLIDNNVNICVLKYSGSV